MNPNRLIQDLANQNYTVGSWLNLASPLAAEVMALAGFSWLAIDAEHAPVSLGEITHMIRAIESRHATALVRVPDHSDHTIGRVLDAGAMGIVAPHVNSAEQAARVAGACRFRPRGRRSAGTTRAATLGPGYIELANEQILVFAQIEEEQGILHAEQIAGVDGIDVVFLGPNDLSRDLGVPVDSPRMEEAIRHVLQAARRMGKHAGIPVGSVEALMKWRAEGFTVLSLSSDFRLLQATAAQKLDATKLSM